MHEYIAAILTLLLIIGFIPQNVVQQRNHIEIMKAEAVVEVAKEEAAQAGCFTNDIISEMLDSFEDAGIDADDVVIGEMTTTPKYRKNSFDERELITYEIGIPIKKIVANNEFYGISDEDNGYIYWFTGEIASERVSR